MALAHAVDRGLQRRQQLREAAQMRLNAKFRRLLARRLMRTKAVVAVARELTGFVWAIAREVQTSVWQGVPSEVPAA